MTFSRIIGQSLIKEILSGAIKKDRLAGSYLFSGPQGVGKWATALEVAKGLNCQKEAIDPCGSCISCRKIANLMHPDVTVLSPLPSTKTEEERERFRSQKIKEPYSIVGFDKPSYITVEEIRQMQRNLCLKPYEARRRVVIIHRAEKMVPTGGNYLLKSLEEPPLDAVLILVSSQPGRLLPTILSRCQKIRFSPVPQGLIENYLKTRYELDPQQAGPYARMSRGSLGEALRLMEEERSQIRMDGLDLIDSALNQELPDLVKSVEELLEKHDRDTILEMFDFLFTLLGDIYVYLDQKEDGKLSNLDLESRVIRLASVIKEKETVEWGMRLVSEIKEECVKRNANLELSLLALVLSLKKAQGGNLVRSPFGAV